MNLIMICLVLLVVSLIIRDTQKEKRIKNLENMFGIKPVKSSINNLYRKVYMEDLAIGNGTDQVFDNEGNIIKVHKINIDRLADIKYGFYKDHPTKKETV